MRGIDRLDFVSGGNFLAVDHQRVFAAKHCFHLAQRVFHGFAVFGLVEIDERLILKLAAL